MFRGASFAPLLWCFRAVVVFVCVAVVLGDHLARTRGVALLALVLLVFRWGALLGLKHSWREQ